MQNKDQLLEHLLKKEKQLYADCQHGGINVPAIMFENIEKDRMAIYRVERLLTEIKK